MQIIPVQPVPAQQLQVVLGGQNCQIALYQKEQGLFVDLNADGTDISVGVIGLDSVPLTWNYSGFLGNLILTDTQADDDPTYDELGTRYLLVYLTEDERVVLL